MRTTGRGVGIAAGIAAATALADALPSVLAIGPLRARLAPSLAGFGDPRHVALTVDDGPDSRHTPAMLNELARLGIRATFFLLGDALAETPSLGRRIVEEGHEVALHGFSHRPHLLRSPPGVARDLARGYAAVREATGTAPRFWRPPHGIPTATGHIVSRRLGMRMVLWGADGREWRAGSTGTSVARRLVRTMTPGATVLLHDSERHARPGTARAALAALAPLVADIEGRGWRIGPLAEHRLPGDTRRDEPVTRGNLPPVTRGNDRDQGSESRAGKVISPRCSR